MTAPLLESLLHDSTIGSGPDWLKLVRLQARDQLLAEGMPGPRTEAWKYSPLRALQNLCLRRTSKASPSASVDAALFHLPGVDGPRVVFVDGVFRAELSDLPSVPGLDVERLSDVLERNPESLRAALAPPSHRDALLFTRLNSALLEEGVVIRVAAGVRVETLLHLVCVGSADAEPSYWQLRNCIQLEAGSALRLIEHHVAVPSCSQFANVVSRIELGSGARLDLMQLQQVPESMRLVRRSEVEMGNDAHLELRSVEAGGQWMRHDLAVQLKGDRSRLVSRGVFVLHGRQHCDTRVDVQHQARDTACDMVWRGVADQRARGVFRGAITVCPGADGADAMLSNKNLLLSDQAEIDTQPVLEIHADEVKAAHGATVGQLDERALFYLRSRGLDLSEARSLLTLAFCRVAFDSISNVALREHLDALLLERLPSDPGSVHSFRDPA